MAGISRCEIARLKEMVPTVAELRIIDLMRDYRVVRDSYYGTLIPPVEKVLLRFLPREEIARLASDEEKDTDGLCLAGDFKGTPEPYAILLADDLRTNETRITLLHETSHMKVNLKFGRNMGHGKHFKRELRRLMMAGAYDNWL